MALRAFRVSHCQTQLSLNKQTEYVVHWHHVCWHCAAEHCGFASEYYHCRCGCGELRDFSPVNTESGFDREFAAEYPAPA